MHRYWVYTNPLEILQDNNNCVGVNRKITATNAKLIEILYRYMPFDAKFNVESEFQTKFFPHAFKKPFHKFAWANYHIFDSQRNKLYNGNRPILKGFFQN